jgi:hypothetical protein
MIRPAGTRAELHEVPPASSVYKRPRLVATRAEAVQRQAEHPHDRAYYPLARWSVSGVGARAAAPVTRELAKAGIALTPGGRDVYAATPLVPGASMSALLADGDVTLGAYGTVTYVDGARVFGFGHPLFQIGTTRFLLGDAYVNDTVPAPIHGESGKLVSPGTVQGRVVSDRADGVLGHIGQPAGIRTVSRARDLGRGTEVTLSSLVAPDDRTVPIIADMMQAQAPLDARDGLGAGTLTLRITIASPALRRPIRYRNVYAAAGDVIGIASGDAARLTSALLQNTLLPIPIKAIRIEQELRPEVRAARIVAARVVPRRVRPGQRASLRVLVQPWRASRRTLVLPFTVPAGLEPGRRALRIVPNDENGFDPNPLDLSDDVASLEFATWSGTLARAVDADAAARPGRRLSRVLRSLARVSADRHDAVRVVAPGEDEPAARPRRIVPAPMVIYGGRALARVVVVAPPGD